MVAGAVTKDIVKPYRGDSVKTFKIRASIQDRSMNYKEKVVLVDSVTAPFTRSSYSHVCLTL